MARIRTIKPEFWSSEQVMDLSIPARLLFIGLWNFCDDGGVHPASIRTLRAEVFPGGDEIDVDALIDELVNAGLVMTFEANDKRYWYVTGWKRHQRIDKPNKKHPQPDGSIPGKSPHVSEFVEDSTGIRRFLDECSPPEGKGIEGSRKGREHIGRDGGLGEGEPAKLPPSVAVLRGGVHQ